MNRIWTLLAICSPVIALASCDREPEPSILVDNSTNAAPEINTADASVDNPPPMIVRSPAYRCDDGAALYVSVLTDENAVTVRDSRSDIPVRLSRNDSSEAFEGDGRTLSGTGSEVRYSSPDRPQQSCREPQE